MPSILEKIFFKQRLRVIKVIGKPSRLTIIYKFSFVNNPFANCLNDKD